MHGSTYGECLCVRTNIFLVVAVIIHVYVIYLNADMHSIKHMFIFCVGYVVNDFVCVCAKFWVPIIIACCVFVFRFVASCSGCVVLLLFVCGLFHCLHLG